MLISQSLMSFLWELLEVTTVAKPVCQKDRIQPIRHRRNLRKLPQG
jgi:hypothetical protein